jgi:hypothetical protein
MPMATKAGVMAVVEAAVGHCDDALHVHLAGHAGGSPGDVDRLDAAVAHDHHYRHHHVVPRCRRRAGSR